MPFTCLTVLLMRVESSLPIPCSACRREYPRYACKPIRLRSLIEHGRESPQSPAVPIRSVNEPNPEMPRRQHPASRLEKTHIQRMTTPRIVAMPNASNLCISQMTNYTINQTSSNDPLGVLFTSLSLAMLIPFAAFLPILRAFPET